MWLEGEMYNARVADSVDQPQTCMDVDLFEVLAELAGLDLDRGAHAAEAMRLAETARRRLAPDSAIHADELDPSDDDAEDDPRPASREA